MTVAKLKKAEKRRNVVKRILARDPEEYFVITDDGEIFTHNTRWAAEKCLEVWSVNAKLPAAVVIKGRMLKWTKARVTILED